MRGNISKNISQHRKMLGICLAIMIVLWSLPGIQMAMMYYFPELDPTYEPSHKMTLWIEPRNESFWLHMDFYETETDARQGVNRLLGKSTRIDPEDPFEKEYTMYAIPKELTYLWVVLDIDDKAKVTSGLSIGLHTSIYYLGSQIQILIEVWEDET